MSSSAARKRPFVPILVTAILLLIAGVVVVLAIANPFGEKSAPAAIPVVAENSHHLDEAPEGSITFVEFLDFECPACAAAAPVVEQLRTDYAGRVDFVQRYLPLPGHRNAEPAALAAEAAAQQGKLSEMTAVLFANQRTWGNAPDDRSADFRSMAEALELDMDAFDAAVADPATLERVNFDRDAALELGVKQTPSFFVDGELLDGVGGYQDLAKALDAALAK